VGVDLGRGIPLPISAITRIEVIKGPVGSVYGPSAFFGVVNLVTTSAPHGAEAWAGLEAAGGQAHAWEAASTWRGEAGPAEVLVSADASGSRGRDWRFPELAGTPGASADGRAHDLDFGDGATAYLRARWRALTASAACGHSFAGLRVRPARDHHAALESLVCFAEAALEGQVAERLSLRGRVSLDSLEQGAGRPTPAPPLGVGLFRVAGSERWVTGELRADWRPWDRARVDVGSTLQLHRAYQHTYADPLTGVDVELEKGFSTSNSWAAAELRLDGGLTLHGGLTFFAHSLFGNRLTPKLAAVWQPDASDTVKAIWSGGFRPPTFVEALLDDQLAFLPNPDLTPESVRSLELAYEHRFTGVASLAASLFWNRYRDLINYETVPAPGLDHPPDPSNPSDFRQIGRNGGTLDTLGGEVALTLRFGDALEAWGGVSVQHASEAARANFPRVTGNLALSTRAAWRPLRLTGRATVVGPRRKDATSLPPGQRAEVPTAVELGAGAALDVPGVPGLQLELGLVNALDTRGVSPAPGDNAPVTELPIAPRTIRADLRYRF